MPNRRQGAHGNMTHLYGMLGDLMDEVDSMPGHRGHGGPDDFEDVYRSNGGPTTGARYDNDNNGNTRSVPHGMGSNDNSNDQPDNHRDQQGDDWGQFSDHGIDDMGRGGERGRGGFRRAFGSDNSDDGEADGIDDETAVSASASDNSNDGEADEIDDETAEAETADDNNRAPISKRKTPVPLIEYRRGMLAGDKDEFNMYVKACQEYKDTIRAMELKLLEAERVAAAAANGPTQDDNLFDGNHDDDASNHSTGSYDEITGLRKRRRSNVDRNSTVNDEVLSKRYKIIAPKDNLGVMVDMISEPDGDRVYVCELCVEGRASTETNQYECDIKDRIINYIYASLGDMPVDTLMASAAAEYNKHVYHPNSLRGVPSTKWTAEKVKGHFFGPLGKSGHVIDPLITAVLCYGQIDNTLFEIRKRMNLQHPEDKSISLMDPSYPRNITHLQKQLQTLADKIAKLKAERGKVPGAGKGAHRSSTLVNIKSNGMMGPIIQYMQKKNSITKNSREARTMRSYINGGTIREGSSCYNISNY